MNAVTTITITDPDLITRLAAADGQIIFQRPTGEPVKTFETVSDDRLPPGVKSPFTDEEIEAVTRQPSAGRSLSEVWRRIHSGEAR